MLYDKIFNSYRNKFIENKITIVLKGLKENDCRNKAEPKNTVKFDEYVVIFENISEKYDPYNFVNEGNIAHVQLFVGDPILENPCSYKSVEKILENVLNNNPDKDWIIAGCDGSPYLLASRMIECYALCPICKVTLTCEQIFISHTENIHQTSFNFNSNRKFKSILLLPGLGHFEINMTKAIFKLLWTVCIEDLAETLGFRSIKALTHCRAATNHHQSWQILQIILDGTSEELLKPYLLQCLEKKIECSATGFFQYLYTVEDPCYKFMSIVIFTYVFAVHLFRCGMRRSNPDVIAASRHKASPLYYGLNMTSYQEIEYRDRFMRAQCPADILNFIKNNECCSVSGHRSKCESGDFLLEAQNRRIKRWMPPGIPTNERWRRVCRNLDRIDKIKKQLSARDMSMNEGSVIQEGGEVPRTDLSNDIYHWRKFLSENKYFQSPQIYRKHVSTSGEMLDRELINFSHHCRNNQKTYFQNNKEKKLQPIFITTNDRSSFNDIKNKTKEEVIDIIEEYIDSMEDREIAEQWFSEWEKDIRKATKATMIQYFRKLQKLNAM